MYPISNQYKEVIYSGDSKNKLKLLFNGVEYTTVNVKSESLKVTSKVLSSGDERFSLDNFVSKEAELIIHDIDLEDIVEPINISIGTLVDEDNETYEYVPIGVFKLSETPTTDSGKTTIKMRDYSVNFDVPYNAQEVVEASEGGATLLQILQDICTKCNITLGTTDFINKDTRINVWDNSINARVYIMYIAEKAGCLATMSRTGELILVDLQRGEDKEVTSTDNIIYINDALPRLLNSLDLQGNTYQQTYTGKNLLKNTSTNSGDNNYWSEYSTYNQITGELTRSTTATTESFITHRINGIKNSTKYTISFMAKSNGKVKNMDIYFYNRQTQGICSTKNITLTTTYQKYIFTFTTDSSTDYSTNSVVRIDNNGSTTSGTTATLTIKDVMLVEGEDTNFEPYVGGIPSPNPDYPQAIQNVTGRQTIDIVGKNLLDKSVTPSSQNGTTTTELDTGIRAKVTATGQNKYTAINLKNPSNLLGKTLTISATITPSGTNNALIRVYWLNGNTLTGLISNTISTTGSYTFTIPSSFPTNKNGIALVFSSNASSGTSQVGDYVDYTNVQLEIGSTATTYEEYKGQSYEINLGKNLVQSKEINSTTSNYATVLFVEADLKPNTTYTISYDGTPNNKLYTNENLFEQITFTNTSGRTTVTTTTKSTISKSNSTQYESGKGWKILKNGTAGAVGGANVFNNLQIETGSQATTYSSYFTPIELNKIGNYKDYIRKSTGKNLLNQVESGGFNTTTGEKTTGNFYRNSEPIQVQPNTTYIFSINGTGTAINVLGYKADMTYTGLVSGSTISANQSFTIPDDVKYINIFRGTSGGNQNWQIEKSSTITSYEPYLPIGTWYIEKKIGKVVLDGSESWSKRNNGDGTNTISFTYNMSYGAYGTNNEYCDRFNYEQRSTSGNEGIGANNTLDQYYIQIKRSRLSSLDVAGFKTWLSSNNVELYYVLSTPTYTEITNTDLINQLESIELLNGINNITVSSGDLTGAIKINYQSEKEYYELNPLLFEKYEVGEELIISRVVYEDAIRKFEHGDESHGTLYINSANPYIIEDSEIENIYRNVRGLNLYSMKISKTLGNPAIDPWDIVKFTYNGNTYKFLAQNTLTYTKNIIQSFDSQIGTNAKSQENVTINAEDSKFKRVFTRIDQAEGNIELNSSQITNVRSDLEQNYYEKSETEQLILNSSTGLTNTFSEAGGNNIFRNTGLWFEDTTGNSVFPSSDLYPSSDTYTRKSSNFEFWNGQVERSSNDKASNKNSLLLQNGALSQEQDVPNGNYTVSFKYIKLIPLSVVKCYINDIKYELTETTDTEFQEIVEVNSQHINVRFDTDTNNSCEIYDLMVNAGSVKLAYSQNQNETTTDTVNISKGITITSSDQQNVVFKANADGVRIFEKNNMTTPKTKFTDKGTETNYLEAKDEAIIVDVLIQRVGNQTWFTKI